MAKLNKRCKKMWAERSLEIVLSILTEWDTKFKPFSCSFGKVELNNNGDSDNYFSEIEAYLWKGNNVQAVFNVILCLNGQRTMTYEELEIEANAQAQEMFSSMIQP